MLTTRQFFKRSVLSRMYNLLVHVTVQGGLERSTVHLLTVHLNSTTEWLVDCCCMHGCPSNRVVRENYFAKTLLNRFNYSKIAHDKLQLIGASLACEN